MKKMRRGLTLMELLTVISILATLAALLYPVYLKVRSRMYEINCANQLRQIGLAIRMYVKDYAAEETPYAMPVIPGTLYPYYLKDESEQDGAEMVGEEVPTANGHERRVAIRQKPNPLLKYPQIKGLKHQEG